MPFHSHTRPPAIRRCPNPTSVWIHHAANGECGIESATLRPPIHLANRESQHRQVIPATPPNCSQGYSISDLHTSIANTGSTNDGVLHPGQVKSSRNGQFLAAQGLLDTLCTSTAMAAACELADQFACRAARHAIAVASRSLDCRSIHRPMTSAKLDMLPNS